MYFTSRCARLFVKPFYTQVVLKHLESFERSAAQQCAVHLHTTHSHQISPLFFQDWPFPKALRCY